MQPGGDIPAWLLNLNASTCNIAVVMAQQTVTRKTDDQSDNRANRADTRGAHVAATP